MTETCKNFRIQFEKQNIWAFFKGAWLPRIFAKGAKQPNLWDPVWDENVGPLAKKIIKNFKMVTVELLPQAQGQGQGPLCSTARGHEPWCWMSRIVNEYFGDLGRGKSPQTKQ